MPRVPSEQEVAGYFQQCRNWGRWGPEDQLGTINFITPEKRRRALALPRTGVTISCARQIITDEAPDVRDRPLLLMNATGERYAAGLAQPGEFQYAREFVGMVFHGFHMTHVDSLAHVFWEGKMYNGFPASEVTAQDGAKKGAVENISAGIVTRGVLLDIPRLKGVRWLEPGTAVFPEDLEEAEEACGVRVESGDVLFVRTGWLRKRATEGPSSYRAPHPGLHAACIPWFHERQIAMLGSDTINDVSPSGYSMGVPIHQITIPGMGLWLIDNVNPEDLAPLCESEGRWEFLLMIGPLRFVRGTGSPVNPIAVF